MTLPIDYSDLVTLFLFIFAIIGLMRGWYKEGVTSFFVAALAILVWQPEMARGIIDTINDLIKLVVMFVKSGFSLQPTVLVAQKVDPAVLLDPESYRLYIVVTVILIALSYVVGEATFKYKMTPLGRLLGGLLGGFNGYIILSLFKQYMLNHLTAKGAVVAQADQLAVQVSEVPTGNFFSGSGIVFIFVVVISVVALLVAGDRLRLPIK
ncbi:MAG: hypothetical protein JXA09_05000 [Anaerolineae bacterium]|nr:hypothetical protein [Anaerolineae bacterium]